MKSTCDIYDDYLEALGVLDPGFRHFGARQVFHGRAVTIKTPEDFSRVAELVKTPGEGRVLVVDSGGTRRCALIGDRLAAFAVENGWSGVVIRGCVRDTSVLATLEIGVVALGSIPRKADRNGAGEVDVPVDLNGVSCAPGDLIIADEDGVLVASGDVADAILAEHAA